MKEGKKEEAEEIKAKVAAGNDKIDELTAEEKRTAEEIKKRMMVIPNIIDPSVPIGKMIAKMLSLKDLVNLLFLILKFHIIQKLWKNSMA